MENSEQVITIVEFLSYYPLKQGLKLKDKKLAAAEIKHFYPTIH